MVAITGATLCVLRVHAVHESGSSTSVRRGLGASLRLRRKLVAAVAQIWRQGSHQCGSAHRRLTGYGQEQWTNTCVFTLSRAGEGVQTRGTSVRWLCGHLGVHWDAAEGKRRLNDGDHKVAALLLSD